MPINSLDHEAILAALRRTNPRSVPEFRPLRRAWSRELRTRPPRDVIALATTLVDGNPWARLLAYELVAKHPGGIGALTPTSLRRLARGLADWGGVDTFACYLAGPAWREGRVSTAEMHRWARSKDRWRRRTAVVSTVPLNVRAQGGRGDVARTLGVCRLVIDDRDDMVVKALSWALRSLVHWDPGAAQSFLDEHRGRLAARVLREVGTKLRTGRKAGA